MIPVAQQRTDTVVVVEAGDMDLLRREGETYSVTWGALLLLIVLILIWSSSYTRVSRKEK